MKRKTVKTVTLLLTAVMLLTIVTSVIAEEQGDAYPLYVIRPKIGLGSHKGSGSFKTLTFGTKLTLLSYEYDYCRVMDPDGDEGFIATGYLGYGLDMLWISNEYGGVYLSPVPGMNRTQFASASGGMRMSEAAIVLMEDGEYLYIVTDEGFTGYVSRYDNSLMDYEQHLWLLEQEQLQNEEQGG